VCEDSGGEVVRGYLGVPISSPIVEGPEIWLRRIAKLDNEQQKIQDQLHVILILSDQATPVTGQTLSVDRSRDIPAVKPVVRSLAATAALFAPPAHSRMMRAQKARDRELPGCSSSCRKVISCSGLATSSWFGGGPRGFDICTKSPLRYLYKLFMTHQTGWHFLTPEAVPGAFVVPLRSGFEIAGAGRQVLANYVFV